MATDAFTPSVVICISARACGHATVLRLLLLSYAAGLRGLRAAKPEQRQLPQAFRNDSYETETTLKKLSRRSVCVDSGEQ